MFETQHRMIKYGNIRRHETYLQTKLNFLTLYTPADPIFPQINPTRMDDRISRHDLDTMTNLWAATSRVFLPLRRGSHKSSSPPPS